MAESEKTGIFYVDPSMVDMIPISDAERAAAERAAATKWKLSEREWEIVRSLGK